MSVIDLFLTIFVLFFLKQKHPDHEQYLNKKIEMYDEMSLIFGEDTATWSSAKSLTDIDSKKRIVDLESNDLDIDFEKA